LVPHGLGNIGDRRARGGAIGSTPVLGCAGGASLIEHAASSTGAKGGAGRKVYRQALGCGRGLVIAVGGGRVAGGSDDSDTLCVCLLKEQIEGVQTGGAASAHAQPVPAAHDRGEILFNRIRQRSV